MHSFLIGAQESFQMTIGKFCDKINRKSRAQTGAGMGVAAHDEEGYGIGMKILIRNAGIEDYKSAEAIMKQVQQMHIDWRPDIYQYSETVLPFDVYEQAVREQTFFVAEYEGHVAGILFILYRHIENCNQVTRNVIFVDSMAVDEADRGKGIGHAFFEFLQQLRAEKGYDGIELQVNAKNRAAYEMYVKYGFTEKSINMELLEPLEP